MWLMIRIFQIKKLLQKSLSNGILVKIKLNIKIFNSVQRGWQDCNYRTFV